jgi:hypothetical protein
MRSLSIALVMALACATPQVKGAADTDCASLQPVAGPFETGDFDYETAVFRTLLSREKLSRKLEMVHLDETGATPEEAVYFVNAREGSPKAPADHILVSVKATENIGLAIQANPQGVVNADVVRVRVDEEIFKRTEALWSLMVSEARFPERVDGFMGSLYYFTADVGPMYGTAYTEGPKPNTCARRLIDTAETLAAYARAKPPQRDGIRRSLLQQISQLMARLSRRKGQAK